MDRQDQRTADAVPSKQGSGPRRIVGGRYVLLDAIGAGGGAVVVRARDQQLLRPVAVKLLQSRDEELRRRFAQEAEILADVDHPSVVRVQGRGNDGEDLYIALEYLAGPDLFEHLIQSGPLSWRQVIEFGIQIASALDAVHRRGLVHRDVKPANIMLDGPGHVKLIDFGVVRISENYRVPTGATPRRATEIGRALGTPGYLPLEAGLVAPNPSFDVFGLGATLYQLLTGKMPEEPIAALREAHPGCDAPADLELVLGAALALEPEDRTRSAAELGRALAAVLAAHPERGTPSERIDGRYELIGLVGTGAKADAYLAVHRGAGHDVVLKFLRSKEPDDILRFTREAKLLRTFDHPALPRFYDHAPEANPPYIAMAHAAGRPAARLCSPPRLKPAAVAAVGVKLAQVLAVVHARGVLHRDVNANNVLIDANGAVTLLDFGYADLLVERFYDVPAGERRYLTPPEARVSIPDGGIGQFAWSAPEVRAGKGWSEKSDVYSMGHLLFRLVTGKVPVKGADPPTSLLESVVTCPEAIAVAIERALRVDPKLRPTAAQLAQALIDAIEDEEEVFARAVTMATPAGRPALRLVTDAPQVRDWTDHPLPDASSEPAAADVLVEHPPALAAAPKVPTTTLHGRTLAWAAVVAMAVLIGWWVQRGERPVVTTRSTLPRPSPVSPAAGSGPSIPAGPGAPVTKEPAASVSERLADATPALTECARKAGRKVWVELGTSKGETHFTKIDIVGDDSEGCAHAVLKQIRFDPPASADTLVKGYGP
jgi:serine/threonine protein kinase